MKTITVRKKKYEKVFENMMRHREYKTEDIQLTRLLPRDYPNLFDKHNGCFEIYRNERKRKSAILFSDRDLRLIPLYEPDSVLARSKKSKKYGIIRY
jgi:hypothetical protein